MQCLIEQIVVNWTDNANNETGYELLRNPPMPSEPVSLLANTITYTDNNPPVPPQAFNYRVRAVISSNPPACRYTERTGPLPLHPACVVYTNWFQCQGGDVVAASGALGTNLAPISAPVPLGLPGMAFGRGWYGN